MVNWFRRHLTTIILIVMAIVGVMLVAYPMFSDWWNSFHQSRAVASYTEAVVNLNNEEYDRMLEEAEAYNAELSESGPLWIMDEEQEERYNSILDVTGSGIMGSIYIPKIDVRLPIYHGVEDAVLQIAIGHISGTSLPVGGESTHCVISGHRGLPSAKLFTDLDKLKEGDTFTITVLDRIMTYEVDQIRIVEPVDLSDLLIEEGKDYFTLVTCTPYGINTHRLLVRGHRVDNPQGEAEIVADAIQIDPDYVTIFIAVPIAVILFILAMIFTGRSEKKKKKRSSGHRRDSGDDDRRGPERRRPEGGAPVRRSPEGRTPERRAPERRSPEGRVPERRAPERRAPEGRTPERRAPERRAPERRAPESRVSERRVKSFDLSDIFGPDVEDTDTRIPEINDTDVKSSEFRVPDPRRSKARPADAGSSDRGSRKPGWSEEMKKPAMSSVDRIFMEDDDEEEDEDISFIEFIDTHNDREDH